MKVAPYIAMFVMAILFALMWKCKGDVPDTKSLQVKSDSLHQAMASLKEKDIAIDDLTAAALEANQYTMEAYDQVSFLKTKLDSVQSYAAGLAKNHWQAIKNNDTAAYKENCDAMAGQLTDSRDSVHNLMAEIDAYKFGVNGFQEKYLKERVLSDSLAKDLSSLKQSYKQLADAGIKAFDSSITTVKGANKLKGYIGANIQVPFGFGPQFLLSTGNKIYSASILAGSGPLIYQVGAHIKLSFKKPSLNLLK